MFKRIALLLAATLVATLSFAWTDIDLELRSEQENALSAVQYDSNETKTQTAVNLNGNQIAVLETLGEMHQVDNAAITVVGTADTWYKVENFSAGHLNNVTFATNGLVLPAGIYHNVAGISLSGTTGNVIQFAFALDGTIDTDHIVERKLGSSDVGAAPLVGYITATVGQSLSLYVKNTAAAADVLIKHCTLMAKRITD